MTARGSGGSIFGHGILLALGSAAAVAFAAIAIVFVRPAPLYFPVSTFEAARLLRGQPIARADPQIVTRTETAAPSKRNDPDPFAAIMKEALARQLGLPVDEVVFEFRSMEGTPFDPAVALARRDYEKLTLEGASLYRDDPRFAPLIFGSFRASIRTADGRWLTVSRTGPAQGPQWQIGLATWILVALLLIIPIVWIFSNRLAGPIRSLAQSADRIGRGNFERIEPSGPAEIRKAAEVLNEMQARLLRQVNERTAVIGAIAHDLRTPLARLAFLIAAAPPDLAKKVDDELSAMERMIAMTLDFVHSETAQPAFEPVDLRLAVEGVIDDFADLGASATAEPGGPILISGDALLLRRLFANLVANGVAYGGGVEARVIVDGDDAIVEIADRGPGMSDADLARAFEPFFRAERSRNASTGGIGLGLTIVNSLARAHGGSVTLANRAGGGLLVRVSLPLLAAKSTAARDVG